LAKVLLLLSPPPPAPLPSPLLLLLLLLLLPLLPLLRSPDRVPWWAVVRSRSAAS
jgi:hypothetical protein